MAEGLYATCDYSVRPYYYQLTEESSFGYQTTHTVLDYIVPVNHLDRTNNLTDCLLGHTYAPDPAAASDEAAGTAGGNILVQPLLNDAGNENLRIVSVADPTNGLVTFTDRTITYTPDAGFVGADTFSYTISDGVTTSSASVTVTVDAIQIYLPLIVR